LQDVTEDFRGNLVVFPRSHFVTQVRIHKRKANFDIFSTKQYFRENGLDEAKRGLAELHPLPLAEPVQVKLRKV
jgi:hypothetical protein